MTAEAASSDTVECRIDTFHAEWTRPIPPPCWSLVVVVFGRDDGEDVGDDGDDGGCIERHGSMLDGPPSYLGTLVPFHVPTRDNYT
ncbi:hypothetical protein M422DRAFT_244128 [Sphaerobolus stellatus SS14]|nr:hypothetical protein M422DRAFT_244128 [Sphaerobolus stellatus SS14]